MNNCEEFRSFNSVTLPQNVCCVKLIKSVENNDDVHNNY